MPSISAAVRRGMSGKDREVAEDKPHKDHHVRRAFLTGLIALFPIAVSIAAIAFAWRWVVQPLSAPFSALIGVVLDQVLPKEWPWVKEALSALTSLAVVVVGVYLIGHAIGNIFGARLQKWMDSFFGSLPVVKFIYPHAKQLSDFLFGARKVKFNRVVAIEYPRKGMYTLGFVTSGGLEEVSLRHGCRMLAIFIPTSPTPFTGWTTLVDEREVMPVEMTVDQAVRFIVSCGVIVPREASTTLLPAVRPELEPPETPLDEEATPEEEKRLPEDNA